MKFFPLVRICLTAVFLIGAVANMADSAEPIVLGYYMAWSKSSYPHGQVPYGKLTHIAHAFVWPNANGSLSTYDYFHYPQLIQSARDNGVRMIVSVGGWGQSDGFSPMVADTNARKKFAEDLIAFCITHGYEGIDLDWEYPDASDKPNLVKLVQELRAVVSQLEDTMTISIALPSSDWRNGYDIPALRDLVDWFGIMTYDFHGSWTNHSGHNSPLYSPAGNLCQDGSLHQSVNYFLQRGLPKSKLLVGMASYGRVFNTGSLYQPPTSSVNNGAAISYTEAMNRISQGWTYHWDDVSKMPYLVNPAATQLAAFEDTVSFRHKTDYIRANGLRGAKVWALSYDNMPGGHPLMETLYDQLNLTTGVSTDPIQAKPEGYNILQNYPNPFNGQTTIRFIVGSAESLARVALRVYDMLGREVAVLIEGEYTPGTYAVHYSPDASAASGVYMCRLEVEGKWNVKTMMYLK